MPTVPVIPPTEKQQLLAKYKKAVAALVKAEASTTLEGQDAANLAYANVISIRTEAQTAGVKVPALPAAPTGVVRSTQTTGQSSNSDVAAPPVNNSPGATSKEYPNYTYDSEKGQPTIGVGGIPQYIVSLPISNRGGMLGDIQQKPFASPPEARNAFIKAYFSGEIPKLQQQLLKSNWTTKERIANGNGWIQDLDAFIADYSSFVVREGQYPTGPVAKDSMAIMDYLSKQKAVGSTTKTEVGRQFSTRAESNQLINQYLINLIGRPATSQEKEEYFQILNSAENKATSTSVSGPNGGKVTGGFLTSSDRELLAAKIARVAIKTVDAKALLAPGTKGSQAAMDVRDLQSYANQYGIQLDETIALNYVASGLGTEDYLNKQKERIRLNSIALYPNFSEHIKAGGTIKDIADQYAYTRAQKLGLTISNSILDKKVMSAMTSGVSQAQYERDLQAEPEWGNTTEARDIGASFSKSILQSFGFGGN